MKKLPTDLQILNAIYKRYYDIFAQYKRGDESRSAKIYVPVDISQIAQDLNVDGDIIFGRLYYNLEKKHGYKQDDGSRVHFFSLCVGEDVNCINFPLMASVLAELREQARKHHIATWIAAASLFISIVAILFSVLDGK